ncbi:MAG: hypothetical protein ACK412_00940 [Chloroherpetonaceae bacterium]
MTRLNQDIRDFLACLSTAHVEYFCIAVGRDKDQSDIRWLMKQLGKS